MTWTTIILEAYCLRTTTCEKHKYNYEIFGFNSKKGKLKTRKIPNKKYNPKYKTPRKPGYCPGKPQYLCLEKGCKYFAYTDAYKEEYLWDDKYWNLINGIKIHCPICDEYCEVRELKAVLDDEEYIAEGYKCGKCGETFFSFEQKGKLDKKVEEIRK